MKRASRIGDNISGVTSGEHNGHDPSHGSCGISGNITSGSHNVFINELPASRVTDLTVESDCCDSNQVGKIGMGSSRVFINGLPAARIGDNINPHNGTAKIQESSDNGSPNVYIRG